MHELLAVQSNCPAGHWHVEPGAGQVSPVTEQGVVGQHCVVGLMQTLTQTTSPGTEHAHCAPGVGQISPVTPVQSALVQHVPVPMQARPATHITGRFGGHAHCCPGPGHVSFVSVQSADVQQEFIGMHWLLPQSL